MEAVWKVWKDKHTFRLKELIFFQVFLIYHMYKEDILFLNSGYYFKLKVCFLPSSLDMHHTFESYLFFMSIFGNIRPSFFSRPQHLYFKLRIRLIGFVSVSRLKINLQPKNDTPRIIIIIFFLFI